jgi:hypothetical protein
MAIGLSAISQVCRRLSERLSDSINDSAENTRVNVLIGTPAAAAPGESDNNHRLNLFFFRFEPSGFDADRLPGETWLLRMHCLVTPFCVDETPVAAGENDLRVIGATLRFFHEHPVHQIAAEGETFLIQSVFLNLGLDQLNQLWSTQGDTVYRPSVLFEMSLVPVIPREPAVGAPLVGSVSLGVRANLAARVGAGPAAAPQVPVMRPATQSEDWTPALCLVAGGVCLQSVSLALGSPELAAFDPSAWVAGAPGTLASLRWETWDSVAGWVPLAAGAPFPIQDGQIDPDALSGAHTRATALPFTDRAGQAVLYAERTYIRAADGASIAVRSNPVLVTCYGPAP